MNVYLEQVGDTVTLSPNICNSGPFPCERGRMAITIPTGLAFVKADTNGKGSYDPISHTWFVGEVAGSEEGQVCHSVKLTLELSDDSSLPLTVQVNVSSDCVEDAGDNVVTYSINTLSNVPGGASDVTLSLPDNPEYTLEAGGLLAYLVYTPTDASQFRVGTTPGGDDIISLIITNLSAKTLHISYYSSTEQVLYFTGNGTVDIFLA